eukprot:2428916-Prorocentrum_lima.AAC.1
MSSGLDWPGATMEGDVRILTGPLRGHQGGHDEESVLMFQASVMELILWVCLLYTSDAADDM